VDVLGNNYIEPLDALLVIRGLNSDSASIATPSADTVPRAVVPGVSTPSANVATGAGVATDVASVAGALLTAAPTTTTATAAAPVAFAIPAISSAIASSANSPASPGVGSTVPSTTGKAYPVKIETGFTGLASAGRATFAIATVDRVLSDLAIDWSDG
jgi:hypothetical protein